MDSPILASLVLPAAITAIMWSMLGVVVRVFAITIVPVAVGMEMRRRSPN